MTTILETINSPADLKKLSMPELKQLANELRTFIIDNVSKTGGHLSSSLGTVELAIAIHYVGPHVDAAPVQRLVRLPEAFGKSV